MVSRFKASFDAKYVISYLSQSPSRFFITTSRDMTARLFTLDPLEGFRPKTFAGHRDGTLNAYFSSNSKTVSFTLEKTSIPTDMPEVRFIRLAVMVLYLHGVQNPANKGVRMKTKICPKSLLRPHRLRHCRTTPSQTHAGASPNGITSTKPTPA